MQTRNGKVIQPAPKKQQQQHDEDAAFGRVPAFLLKTFDLVGDDCNSEVVSWEADGQSFVIWQPAEFSRDLLPQYFKHSNLASFVRQLNTYGFQKASPDRWEFHHPNFKRAHPELLTNIPRRRTTHKTSHIAAETMEDHQSLAEQVHMLKQDKRIIMMEVLKLQQHQQRADQETQKLSGRLEKTEQAHRSLMKILTAAAKDPSILPRFLACAPERLSLTDSPGAKRVRSWTMDDGANKRQIVTRNSVEDLWPQLLAGNDVGHQPDVGPLPAAASKAVRSQDEFSFVPVSGGVTAAMSPFAARVDDEEVKQEQEPNEASTEAPEAIAASTEDADISPLSLRSADLVAKSPGSAMPPIDEAAWSLPSLNFTTEWGSRVFDVLGSQPSWTFAVGQGMEAVH